MEKVLIDEEQASWGVIVLYWAPAILYALLIFYLSAQSHPEEQLPEFLFKQVSDKVLHAVEYAVLGVLLYRAWRRTAGPAAAGRAVLFAFVAASFYGATDEVHQMFVPLREANWLDWVADTVGSALGSWGGSRFKNSAD